MSDSTDKAVVFAVDIGVYISSSDGNPTPGTTFGWAKRYLPLAAGVAGRESMPVPIRRNPDSHSIRAFVDSIVADLDGGYRVALGFEAPMWVPILHALPPDPFRLYQTRFSHEKTREWYLQPGAAATAKALTFAVLLFSLLKERVTVPRLTIDRSKWDGGCILLFEAFVAGAFKLPTPPLADRDEWDAQTAAVASGLWLAPMRDTPLAAQQFVQADHDESGILSLWATAAHAAGLDDADCRGRCEVIGLQPKAPG